MIGRALDLAAVAIAAQTDPRRRRHFELGVELGDVRMERKPDGTVLVVVADVALVETNILALGDRPARVTWN